MPRCDVFQGAVRNLKAALVWFSALRIPFFNPSFSAAPHCPGECHTTLFCPKSFTGEQAGAFLGVPRAIS